MTLLKIRLIIKKIVSFLNLLIDRIIEKDLFTQSAALAYYCALSLAPLLILLVSIFSLLGADTLSQFLIEVELVLGKDLSEIIHSIIISIKNNHSLKSASEIIGFLVLIFSASSVFNRLKITLTSIFSNNQGLAELPVTNNLLSWVKYRIFSIGIMIGFIFISLSSLLISVLISLFLSGQRGMVVEGINQLIFLIIYTFIFSLVFYWVPHKKINKFDSLWGGIIAAILFMLGKSVIGLYLSQAAVGSAYGAAGSLIVLLIWVYYSSFIFFVAGVLTSLLSKIRKES